jgi:hypothetical protein
VCPARVCRVCSSCMCVCARARDAASCERYSDGVACVLLCFLTRAAAAAQRYRVAVAECRRSRFDMRARIGGSKFAGHDAESAR